MIGKTIRCNLCSMIFDTEDKLIKNRMKTHEKYHKERFVTWRSPNGQNYKDNVNTARGKVEWINE